MDSLITIFTDLDGTFLDHKTYSFKAALPCLAFIHENNIPLIFTSSKTAPEIEQLCKKTSNFHPFISENGGLISIPDNYFPAHKSRNAKYIKSLIGIRRTEISSVLNKLKMDFRFTSFQDMGVEGIINATGLAKSDAEFASQRQCTEPIQWQDTEQALKDFMLQIEKHSLQCVRGGRFLHIMGHHDKASTMTLLVNEYKKYCDADIISIALGDSPNDFKMLNSADHGIYIPNPVAPISKNKIHENIIYAQSEGPEGWNDSLLRLLEDYFK